MPPPGYLRVVRDLCDRQGIVYIADEVLAGFGRTGAWFAVDHAGVAPDLMAFAKGVNSGYVPRGGVLVGDARLDPDLGPALRKLAATHPSVGDVRGIGGLWSLELVRDRGTREPLAPPGASGAANAPMSAPVKACLQRGLQPLVRKRFRPKQGCRPATVPVLFSGRRRPAGR